MTTTTDARPGLRWSPAGVATLWGPPAELREAVDRAVVRLAGRLGATDIRFPTVVEAGVLDRIGWFKSFPHLATFAVSLDDDDANLDAFRANAGVRDDAVPLTATAPVRAVLNPAACFHVYSHHEHSVIDGPVVVTTRNTCFRREASYVPLERQWSFEMRELVCLGPPAEVRSFLVRVRQAIDELLWFLELPAGWAHATDPFFRAAENPKHLMQRVDPVKHELLYDDRLAIASTNFHHDAFGSAFDITRSQRCDAAAGSRSRRRSEQAPFVTTGCVAFGLERWVGAILDRHGPDPQRWPDVERVFGDASVASR